MHALVTENIDGYATCLHSVVAENIDGYVTCLIYSWMLVHFSPAEQWLSVDPGYTRESGIITPAFEYKSGQNGDTNERDSIDLKTRRKNSLP